MENGNGVTAKAKGARNPAFEAVSADETEMSPGGKSIDRQRVSAKSVKSEPITYTWKNINVWAGPPNKAAEKEDNAFDSGKVDEEKGCFGRTKKKAETKQILKNVSGVVRPGELVAIMGASGAGKTSLLNVLTYRNTKTLRITGDRSLNGVPLTREMLSSVSAYVQQDDLFIGTLTVRETLVFQARLRMHSHIPLKQRLARVEEVIQDLGLSKCADTLIGVPGRIKGISGGEMKRLSFASEVLTDPPLMFCDEPTSGLDSYMAQNVVSVLKTLASKGKTIVCTIHQPSSQVYAMFDKILLIAEGRTAFLGDCKEAVTFFSGLGHICPPNFNPSDFFIQTLAIQPGNEAECRAAVTEICDNYEDSDAAIEVARALEDSKRRNSDLSRIKSTMTSLSPYKANWFSQFGAVLWRSWVTQIRDPMLFSIRLATTVFIAVLFGIIYLRQDYDQEGIMNLNGALFLFLTNMTFQNVFAVVNVFCGELPIFLREHLNGMYRTDVYFLAKTISELPIYIIFPVIFTSIVYWMVGFNSDVDRFFVACGIVTLIANTAASFGYMVSCLTGSVNTALALGPVLIVPMMLFGGFFLNAGSVPVYFIWLKYLSWFYYGNEALALNQWKGVTNIVCPEGAVCIKTGDQLLDQLNFNKDNLIFDICMLGVLLVGFRLVAFVALLVKSYRK